MKLGKLLTIGIIGLGAYLLLTKTSSATSTVTGTEQVTTPVTTQQIKSIQSRTMGVYDASLDAPYLTGSSANKLSKLIADPTTAVVLATENPLTFKSVSYTGDVKQSSVGGKGASDEAKKAARKENAQQIARVDPSYKNTLSYQKIMSS